MLKVVGKVRERAAVGSVLLWLGEKVDDAVPADGGAPGQVSAQAKGKPTAGARARLKELGLSAEQVPAAGERLTEADIEAWLAARSRAGATTQERALPAAQQ